MALPVVPDPPLQRAGAAGPRLSVYPPVWAWSEDFGAARYAEALRELRGRDESLALYAHFPFCAKRCLYCGFNAVPTSRALRIDRYLADLERELDLVVDAAGRGAGVSQMHWGGGTPNHLNAVQIERAFRLLADRFTLTPNADLSLDADPRHVSAMQLRHFRSLGFTRIGYGVQDFDLAVQRAIGRVQPLVIVSDAVRMAREAGFTEIGLDLVLGLPRQSVETVDATLSAALAMEPERFGCFSYVHAPEQHPHQRTIPTDALPNALERMAQFRRVVDRLGEAGYVWIGVDQFVHSGHPLAVAQRDSKLRRSVLDFTTHPVTSQLGVGMGAISALGDGVLVQNATELTQWGDAVRSGSLPITRGHALSDDDRRRGAAIRALLCHLELPESMADGELAGTMDELKAFEADGFVRCSDGRVRVTTQGHHVLPALLQLFDAYTPARRPARILTGA